MTDKGFRHSLKAAEPRYVVPTRATFRCKHLPSLYQDSCLKFDEIIAVNFNKGLRTISVTTDALSSPNFVSFVTFTLHFLAKNFQMRNFVIETHGFCEEHTAIDLKLHSVSMLSKRRLISSSENLNAITPQKRCDANSLLS